MLTSEFDPPRSLSQQSPQEALGQRHFLTQSSRAKDCIPRSPEHRVSPSTTLRVVPLPVPGRHLSI
jgi:hypothetical protein